MNKDIKKLWTESLRSGKYKQGKEGGLKNGKKVCCLGVLCDISGLGKWGKRFHIDNRYFYNYINNEEDSDYTYSELPDFIVEWAQLEDYDPFINDLGSSLSHINDSGYNNFNKIADLIEKNL